MHPENFTILRDMVFYEMLTSLSACCHMEKFVLGTTVYTRQSKLNFGGHDKFIAATSNISGQCVNQTPSV
jgi:spore coat protein U-like protein